MAKLTARQRDALVILRDWKGPPPSARAFARKFWPPDDESWKASWQRSPSGMWMNGGRMLWRLWAKSLAQSVGGTVGLADRWTIAPGGRLALTAAETAAALIHHAKHGDMDGQRCLLSACAFHYPQEALDG